MNWYQWVKFLLFALDAEVSHDLTLNSLKLLQKLNIFSVIPAKSQPRAEVKCFGLTFPNPVGLAAGLDKNADCIPAWDCMGFGFIEIGTVTPRPQPGNAKPRLFRLPKNQAIINRMGFNNKGVDYLIERVKQYPVSHPLGINIGKNKDTPLNEAANDYLQCFAKVYPYADYVVVNLSSPNTPGLKSLQHGVMLKNIIQPLKNAQSNLSEKFSKYVPLLVKISPDLYIDEIKEIVNDLINLQVDGVIATNTTTQRPKAITDVNVKEEGGLSGDPLFQVSTEMVKVIYQQAGEALPIIAVGGIMTPTQAKEKLSAGAKLIQLYSGFIYQGPSLIQSIVTSL